MVDALLYRLPENREEVARVAFAFPVFWNYMSASLVAPTELIEQGRVSMNSDLNLTGNLPMIHASPGYARDDRLGFDLGFAVNEIILGDKEPHTITIDVGRGIRSMSYNQGGKIARRGLALGYTGRLEVRKLRDRPREGYELSPASAHIEIEFEDGHESMLRINGKLPPHVGVAWYERYGGSRDDIESFVRQIEGMGLERLMPEIA